jgi:hypothetical protein
LQPRHEQAYSHIFILISFLPLAFLRGCPHHHIALLSLSLVFLMFIINLSLSLSLSLSLGQLGRGEEREGYCRGS